MQVFVTGATGFVGEAVVRALLGRGHAVTGLVRDPEGATTLRALGMTPVVGEMDRPDSYTGAAAAAQVVIHAAQEKTKGRWTRRVIRRMHDSDEAMTRALAGVCGRTGALLVYTSGALNYKGAGDGWIDETTPCSPCELARGHARMEEYLRDEGRRGLRAAVVTPGFVYGNGGLLRGMVDQVLGGWLRVIDRGATVWSLVHVDDLAALYALVAEQAPAGETFLAGDDQPLTRRQLADAVAEALGRPRPGQIPGWLASLFVGPAVVEAVRVSMRLRNDKAKRGLGWALRYPTLAEGLPPVLAAMGVGKPG